MRKKENKDDRRDDGGEITVAGLDSLAFEIKEDEKQFKRIQSVATSAVANALARLEYDLGREPNNAEIWLLADEVASILIDVALEDYRGDFLKKQREMM